MLWRSSVWRLLPTLTKEAISQSYGEYALSMAEAGREGVDEYL